MDKEVGKLMRLFPKGNHRRRAVIISRRLGCFPPVSTGLHHQPTDDDDDDEALAATKKKENSEPVKRLREGERKRKKRAAAERVGLRSIKATGPQNSSVCTISKTR